MLNKLVAMLNNEESNIVVNVFEDLGETTLHLANLQNMFVTVIMNEENELEVYLEEYDPWSEEYFQIECRHYKTAGRAFNYIKKMLP